MLAGVVAVFAFGRSVELLGAPRATAFSALVPVVAILAGIPLTAETPSALALVGLGVVTTGLFVSQRAPRVARGASPRAP